MSKAIKWQIGRLIAITLGLFALVLGAIHLYHYIHFFTFFNQSARNFLARASRIRDSANKRYQLKVLQGLPPNHCNGIYYWLDDLFDKAKVCEAPHTPTDVENVGIIGGFEFNDAREPKLIALNRKAIVEVKDKLLRVQQSGNDCLVNETALAIPARSIDEIRIYARANKAVRLTIALSTKETVAGRSLSSSNPIKESLDVDLLGGSTFRMYVLDLRSFIKANFRTEDQIRTLSLVPGEKDGAVIDIDFIRIMSIDAKYRRKISGIDHYSIGNESREVLYMLPPQRLQYSLKIPDRSPSMEFGTAIIGDMPTTFEVTISDQERKTTIYSETVSDSRKWRDRKLDLSAWKGRDVLVSLAVMGASENIAFWSSPRIHGQRNRPFNVIFILEDALRSDRLSLNGYSLVTSPVRDRLFSKQGIVFTNAISQSYFTRASLPSIMTSLLPTATGVWHIPDFLSDDYLTLAEVMRNQGFVTASFVQNPNAGTGAGLQQGFCQVFDAEKNTEAATIETQTEAVYGSQLMEWLKTHADQNYFLYLHILDPHGPYAPPAPFDKWYRQMGAGNTPVDRTYLDPEFVKQPSAEARRLLYDGEIAHNDFVLQRLLESLDNLGMRDDTLLVFLSDHGEHLGEHGVWDHGTPGYIQTIHVPLGFVYPSRLHVSKRIGETVQLLDLMPTILEFAGIESKQMLLQGDSLVDLIEGRNGDYWKNRILVSEEISDLSRTAKKPSRSGSVFFRDYHLISAKSLFKGSWRLPAFWRMRVYNFRNDVDEENCLFSFLADFYARYRYEKFIEDLQACDIAAWAKMTRSTELPVRRMDPDKQRRLKALGYLK